MGGGGGGEWRREREMVREGESKERDGGEREGKRGRERRKERDGGEGEGKRGRE